MAPPHGTERRALRASTSHGEVELGLTFRSLADTTAATLEYHFSRPAAEQERLRAGLTAEREREILELWRTTYRRD